MHTPSIHLLCIFVSTIHALYTTHGSGTSKRLSSLPTSLYCTLSNKYRLYNKSALPCSASTKPTSPFYAETTLEQTSAGSSNQKIFSVENTTGCAEPATRSLTDISNSTGASAVSTGLVQPQQHDSTSNSRRTSTVSEGFVQTQRQHTTSNSQGGPTASQNDIGLKFLQMTSPTSTQSQTLVDTTSSTPLTTSFIT